MFSDVALVGSSNLISNWNPQCSFTVLSPTASDGNGHQDLDCTSQNWAYCDKGTWSHSTAAENVRCYPRIQEELFREMLAVACLGHGSETSSLATACGSCRTSSRPLCNVLAPAYIFFPLSNYIIILYSCNASLSQKDSNRRSNILATCATMLDHIHNSQLSNPVLHLVQSKITLS